MNMSLRSHRAGVSRDAAVEKSSGQRSALDGTCQRLNWSSHVAAGVVARIALDSSIVRRLAETVNMDCEHIGSTSDAR